LGGKYIEPNIGKESRNAFPLEILKTTVGFYLATMEIAAVVKEEGLITSGIP